MKSFFDRPDAKSNTKAVAYYESELKRVLTHEELSDDTKKGIEELLEFYSTNTDHYLFLKEAKLLLDQANAELEKRMMEDLTD